MQTLFEIETERVHLRWAGPVRPAAHRHVPIGHPDFLRVQPVASDANVSIKRTQVPAGSERLVGITEGPLLFEQTPYQVSAQSKNTTPVSIRHRDPVLTSTIGTFGLNDDGVTGSINFRGDVGRSKFSVWVDGVHEFDFEVEVFPSKLDYKTDYENMLAEVTDLLMGLALEYLRSTYRMSGSFSVPDPLELEWLTLLRHVLDDLERALQRISRQPERRLIREPNYVRPEGVRRVDSNVRRAVVRGQGAGAFQHIPEVGSVRAFIPEQRPMETLDTPEHRWLRAQLSDIRYRLTSLRREERRNPIHSSRRQALLDELTHMEDRVSRLLNLEPLAYAIGPPPPNFGSLVLQRTMGYREAYTACLVLRLGLRLEGGPFELTLKDINTLYEYWCYLSVMKLVSEELDVEIDPRSLFKITANGLRFDLRHGQTKEVPIPSTGGHLERSVRLSYNPTFSTPTGQQRPDVGLAIELQGWNHPFSIIFDAKYRVDSSPDYVRRHGAPGPPEDGVNVLHRYRDAILVRGDEPRPKRKLLAGAALFPLYDPTREFEGNTFYKSLDEVGIGALPFLPTETAYVREWLRSLLAQTGWQFADHAVQDRTAAEAEQWRREASEPALIAVLRPGVGHMDWISENHMYYASLDGRVRLGPRRFVAKWVGFFQGRRDRSKVGAVTHEAEIIEVDVLRRGDIPTPWRASDPDELCIVYTLGPIVERERPIEVPEGIRSFRWASRLSLTRTTKARELYIETEAEWRLYEALLARGLDFDVQPGPARIVDPNDVRGRATFQIGDVRVRHAGAAGFRIDTPGRRLHVPDVAGVLQGLW